MKNIDLPDLDHMMELIDKIRNLSIQVSKLDLRIKYLEAITFREAKEKGMAVNFTDNAYKVSGLNDEIIPLRIELSEKKAELDAARYEWDLNKNIIEIWRTISANERSGLQ